VLGELKRRGDALPPSLLSENVIGKKGGVEKAGDIDSQLWPTTPGRGIGGGKREKHN